MPQLCTVCSQHHSGGPWSSHTWRIGGVRTIIPTRNNMPQKVKSIRWSPQPSYWCHADTLQTNETALPRAHPCLAMLFQVRDIEHAVVVDICRAGQCRVAKVLSRGQPQCPNAFHSKGTYEASRSVAGAVCKRRTQHVERGLGRVDVVLRDLPRLDLQRRHDNAIVIVLSCKHNAARQERHRPLVDQLSPRASVRSAPPLTQPAVRTRTLSRALCSPAWRARIHFVCSYSPTSHLCAYNDVGLTAYELGLLKSTRV